eukprot:CAMPEP_0170551038 /NCGR_PEP_ID=MMETSP0211-20121228/9047_1 /TAXON_ID=311385 /ORGANISM="Pseudokeronopsis sp., Strain OXSARD2" /LENGTH=82 /DNA_ID=CAMNT_0010857937 /DNA_START=271 /DNA_END=519 /DNA_ORIENTATION=+
MKDIAAFKEAMDKESKLYSKIGAIKDETDSQHIWAGGKIMHMYRKASMNFKPGMMKKVPSASSAFKSEYRDNKNESERKSDN